MEKTVQVALAFALLLAGVEVGKRLAAQVLAPASTTTANQ